MLCWTNLGINLDLEARMARKYQTDPIYLCQEYPALTPHLQNTGTKKTELFTKSRFQSSIGISFFLR